MGKTRKYYIEAWKNIRAEFGWTKRKTITTIVSTVIGFLLYLTFRDIEAMLEEVITFIAFVFAPFGIISFVYLISKSITIPAKMYYKVKNEADLYTWNDVEFEVIELPESNFMDYALSITHEKEFDLTMSTKVAYFMHGKETKSKMPDSLAWYIGRRTFDFGEICLSKNDLAELVLFQRYERNGRQSLAIPKDGQPNDRSGIRIDFNSFPIEMDVIFYGSVKSQNLEETTLKFVIQLVNDEVEIIFTKEENNK